MMRRFEFKVLGKSDASALVHRLVKLGISADATPQRIVVSVRGTTDMEELALQAVGDGLAIQSFKVEEIEDMEDAS